MGYKIFSPDLKNNEWVSNVTLFLHVGKEKKEHNVKERKPYTNISDVIIVRNTVIWVFFYQRQIS